MTAKFETTSLMLRETWGHPGNQGHRVGALLRMVIGEIAARGGWRRLAPLGSAHVVTDIRHYASMRLLRGSPPDWNEMQVWRRVLKSGDFFVDVGANVGIYSLWAAQSGAEVLAIEPDRHSLKGLRTNLALNPTLDIRVLDIALGAQQGTLRLAEGGDAENYVLLEPDAPGQDVPVTTLDDLLDGRPVKGVKIDVEGAERLVLDGAAHSIRSHQISFFQIEWNLLSQRTLDEPRDVAGQLLLDAGYVFHHATARGELKPVSGIPSAARGLEVFAVAPGVEG